MTFWQLSTYDLAPPAASYDEEVAALRTLSRQEDSKYISADRSSDRTKRMTANSHRERRNRYNTFINVLGQEFKEQTVARAFTIKRLVREKQHWFSHCKVTASHGRQSTHLFSSVQSYCSCRIPSQALYTTTLHDLAYGRRFLCPVHQGHAPAGHSWFSHTHVL